MSSNKWLVCGLTSVHWSSPSVVTVKTVRVWLPCGGGGGDFLWVEVFLHLQTSAGQLNIDSRLIRSTFRCLHFQNYMKNLKWDFQKGLYAKLIFRWDEELYKRYHCMGADGGLNLTFHRLSAESYTHISHPIPALLVLAHPPPHHDDPFHSASSCIPPGWGVYWRTHADNYAHPGVLMAARYDLLRRLIRALTKATWRPPARNSSLWAAQSSSPPPHCHISMFAYHARWTWEQGIEAYVRHGI